MVVLGEVFDSLTEEEQNYICELIGRFEEDKAKEILSKPASNCLVFLVKKYFDEIYKGEKI